ncbi:hypothetical protein P3S68_030414 [Capsicum galapagoense]
MKYDTSTKQVTLLLEGLSFANGVALSKDKTFGLVAETSACRILRYWLKGPNNEFKRGILGRAALESITTCSIANIKFAARQDAVEQMHNNLLVGGQPHATAIKLSEEGQILEVLEDVEGKKLRYISEVDEEDNGKLWITSVMMSSLGVYQLF